MSVPSSPLPARRPEPLLGRRAVIGGLAASLTALALTACTEKTDLQKQSAAGDGKNYIGGNGTVEEFAPENRGEPVEFEGTLFSGKVVSASDYRDQVLVLNFWYAACPPCRTEAPHMKELAAEHKGKAQFLGVNIRDEKAAAEAFERTFSIPYPSVRDLDGRIQLAMSKYVPPTAVPTTLVIDRSGKVAARILGAAEKSTLNTLIKSNLS